MTTDRDVTQLLRSWLHENAPMDAERVLIGALEQVDTTAQRGAGFRWPLPRFTQMHHIVRFSVMAAVVATAAFFGFQMLSTVGTDGRDASPAPDSSARAEASVEPGSEIPAALQHPFIGEPRNVIGMGDQGIAEMLFTSRSFEFIGGTGSSSTMRSTPELTSDGLLRLTALSSEAICHRGDVGEYQFSFSREESILTLSPLDDACTARMEAITGDWQRSDCRNLDNWCLGNLGAGQYSSEYFDPRPVAAWQPRFGAFQYTVPEGWANSEDYPETYALMPQSEYATVEPDDCGTACPDTISLFAAPEPAPLDCSEPSESARPITARELNAWIANHPGLEVDPNPQSFTLPDGIATMYDVRLADDWTGTCDVETPFVAAPLFHHPGGYHIAIGEGDRLKVIILDLGDVGGATPDAAPLLIVIDSRDPANLDRFTNEALYVIGSFRFPPD